jgi:hypothetical protein
MIFCILSFLGLCIVLGDNSAPRQAAGAALAIGFTVVPYVFARCIEKGSEDIRRTNELLEKIIALQTEPGTPPGKVA